MFSYSDKIAIMLLNCDYSTPKFDDVIEAIKYDVSAISSTSVDLSSHFSASRKECVIKKYKI